ncbi:ubiquitin carboxyl-terminal hydrolase 40 [Gadus morhua]|uniref:ubiquitin carboxyl-terminal hydrolase 40 n=1 Tax=Gadus morhua TaxID=8049 RepID=UPI0011B82C9C|nr:ubiquitin carboxyl-terminal hydrolase 40 [Gadus morhua]
MFGCLFEEEEEAGFSPNPGLGRVAKGIEEPPPTRGKSNLSGIKNQGGTCYLNSLLQTLLFTPEFREELFSLGQEELGLLEGKDKPEAKVRVIPLELQRLFAHLLLVDQQSASTTQLTDSFGWKNNEETNQHDVQELNRILFSALEHSLVDTSGSSLIHRLYHGTIVNNIVCSECGNVSQRQEDFLDLTACVCGMGSLENALWAMFVEEEMFEGNNLYRCAKCDGLVTAAKSAKLQELPPFITMSLLRFSFDFAKCERYKEMGRYTFPLTINLRPFCEQIDGEDAEFTYKLFSVIIHKGGCYGGHYHAFIRDIDQLGKWEPPEEDSKNKFRKTVKTVEEVPEVPEVKEVQEVKELQEPKLDVEDPLCLLTAVISQEPSKSVLLDQLGQKLLDKTGSSWGKKFRKHHGPIGKFLQSHSDVFMLVSNGTRVALKSNQPSTAGSSPAEPSPPTKPSPAPQPGTPPEPEHNPGPEPEGDHWFDLNDSTVASIRESDIERQFQGKESAYMLFYRKVQLPRPSEAFRNPLYKVPPHLVQMAAEENLNLQRRRETFENSSNSVELRLHLAPSYRLENGALQPMSIHQEGVTPLSFDRRKTVGDLRLSVYQMLELWEGDMALTVAKSLPAGLHLYNTLTDDGMSLYSAGIVTNSDLFVWNGREVAGAPVLTGAEWEPVLLTVVRPYLGDDGDDGGGGRVEEKEGDAAPGEAPGKGKENGGPGLIKETRGFACGATLGEVREALGEPQESMLCQVQAAGKGGGAGGVEGQGGGASGWKVFPPADLQRTLKELSLKDGDKLLVLEPQSFDSSLFSLSGELVTVTTPSDCRWLLVEFRPHRGGGGGGEGGGDGVGEEERKSAKVPASGIMSIGEVKQRAIEELHLKDQLSGVECCLRPMDRTGKHLLTPVCEELSVRDAGVRLMTTLILCLGKAPTTTQLFLHYSLGTAPSAGMEMDIIVEQTCTVKECLKAMLEAIGLEGDSWHLRILDWCDEVGEPLMNEDAPLSELNISCGDTLVITQGQLPPKGYLNLSVWLLLDAESDVVSYTDGDSNHTNKGSSEDVNASGVPGATLRALGKVEIPDEATLEDLKIQVMTLPGLQSVCVPTPAFLRLWQLEERRPVRIHRGQQLTLRKLKVTGGAELCVQRLLSEEDLGLKEVLLRVQMAVPGEGRYYPAEELVWNASRDSSPGSLRSTLAARYGLSPDALLLAKQHPDKHTWDAITSWSQQTSKRKKKKKTESLLGAPFHLKDGDMIGIKNLLVDSSRDFCTLEDLQGQQRLREEEEQRRKGGASCAAGVENKASCKGRRPEVALSINVGTFR